MEILVDLRTASEAAHLTLTTLRRRAARGAVPVVRPLGPGGLRLIPLQALPARAQRLVAEAVEAVLPEGHQGPVVVRTLGRSGVREVLSLGERGEFREGVRA